MPHTDRNRSVENPTGPVTELTLSDRLITLAKDAERAGFHVAAERLIRLACDVFDEARVQQA